MLQTLSPKGPKDDLINIFLKGQSVGMVYLLDKDPTQLVYSGAGY